MKSRSNVDKESRNKVDDYVATLEPAQAAIVATIRDLVREASPELREVFKWGQPVWELNGPVCYVKAYRASTNFGFWRGVEVAERADPERLLTGDGVKMRHLKLARVNDIPVDHLKRLIRTAVELNRSFGDPTKGDLTRAY
jgi:hypothetical protein